MNLRHIITVEPVVFLFFTGSFLCTPALQQLALKKICEEIYIKEEICGDLTYHLKESQVVQSKVSYFLLFYTSILTFVSIPPSILLGSWSDQGRHKLGMILPNIGAAFSGIIFIAIVEVEGMSIYWCFLGATFMGLSGNYVAIILSIFSYVASITDQQNRTLRFGIVEAMILIGGTVGFLLSGWLLQYYTYIFVFSVFCGCHLVSILYVILWLREPDDVPEQVMEAPPATSGTTQIASIFSPFVEMWHSFSKVREG
uniref:Proton-coupled folate transporter-like n=2 Tax=Callorhinchus milii TaxID=7868 RepID=A0A4W3KIC8_CALMI